MCSTSLTNNCDMCVVFSLMQPREANAAEFQVTDVFCTYSDEDIMKD